MTPEQLEKNMTIPGWFSEYDIRGLASLARKVTNGTIIEIGSMHGRSAYTLSVSSPTSKIFCLDFWLGWGAKTMDEVTRPNTLATFESYVDGCANVTPVQLFHDKPLEPIWEEPVDMVFLDAAHTNPSDWEYIMHWLPRIKKGGILCGHDYFTEQNSPIDHYPDVSENISKLEKMLDQKVVLHPYSSVWSFII